MSPREEFLRLVADGCHRQCEYDEAEGGLLDHCKSCRDKIAALAHRIFVRGPKVAAPEFPPEQFSNGLTKAEEEMLQLMEEECAELIQAVSKIKRHGRDSNFFGNPKKNMENLHEEAADVVACLGILSHNGLLDSQKVNEVARLKLERIRDPKTRRVHFITPEMIP
jgi:NTP pyrophosphatase (non-canonical NTP hydrolase)